MKRKLLSTIVVVAAAFMQNAFGQMPLMNAPSTQNFHLHYITAWHVNGTRDNSLVGKQKCASAFDAYKNTLASISYNNITNVPSTISIPALSLSDVPLTKKVDGERIIYMNNQVNKQIGNYELSLVIYAIPHNQMFAQIGLFFKSSSLECALATSPYITPDV